MTDYRVYKLDSSGKTTGPPLIVNCENETQRLSLPNVRWQARVKPSRFGTAAGATTTIPSDLDGERLHSGVERTRSSVDSHFCL